MIQIDSNKREYRSRTALAAGATVITLFLLTLKIHILAIQSVARSASR